MRTCAMRVASRPMISGRHAATYTPDRPSLKTSSHTPLCPVWHRDLSYSCRIQEYDRDRSCSWHSLGNPNNMSVVTLLLLVHQQALHISSGVLSAAWCTTQQMAQTADLQRLPQACSTCNT